MREILEQYGGMIIGLAGAAAVFMIYGTTLLHPEGAFARMIALWGNGGS